MLRTPWVVWAVHAALFGVGLAFLGGKAFGPAYLVLWAVTELTYLSVVQTMSARGDATPGATVHVGVVAALIALLAAGGLVLPWLWLPMLALVVPLVYEVAVIVVARVAWS